MDGSRVLSFRNVGVTTEKLFLNTWPFGDLLLLHIAQQYQTKHTERSLKIGVDWGVVGSSHLGCNVLRLGLV